MARYAVTIIADSLAAATRLRSLGFDLHERAARRLPDGVRIAVPAILDDDQIRRVQAAGFTVQTDQNMDEVAAERAADVDTSTNRLEPDQRSAGGRESEPGIDRAQRADEDAEPPDARSTLELLMDLTSPDRQGEAPEAREVLGGYLTTDEIESALAVLVAAHPTLVTLVELPEETWEHRTTHAIRMRAGDQQSRVGVLVTGGIHAREWGGSDVCVAFATNLLKAYASDQPVTYGSKTFSAAQVKAILEKLDIFVFPNVNPDGKAFSQTADLASGKAQDRWWRKNRNPNPGLISRGVDVNRNFDFLWGSGIGTSKLASSFTYRGAAPFSEPEARNVRHLLDANPSIAYFVDVHSYGELILYSWGDDDDQTSDPNQNFQNQSFAGVRGKAGDAAYQEFIPSEDLTTVRQIADAMNDALNAVRDKRYTVQQAVGLYPTSATSDDYAFSRHLSDPALGKVYGFTIELGQQFVPPYDEMRLIMADVSSALTELCRLAAGA